MSENKIQKLVDELEESRARAHAILETSVDAHITIDDRGRILRINPAAVNMFGYSEEEAIGKNVTILMPIPYSEMHDTYIQNYLKTGEKKVIANSREVQGLKKDGTIFPIDVAVSEVEWKGHRTFSGIIKDLTKRKEMERRMLQIGDDERRRIGRELHDGLGQMLTGIRMVSESLARKLKANGVPGADEVLEISQMVREADEYARTITRGMVQVDLEKNGLSVALQNLCKQIEKMFGIHCSYNENGTVTVKKHTTALNLFRIAQESVHNAARHGGATSVTVRLSETGYHISLTVDDNGTGFPSHPEDESGMGIDIMKYRAGILGGILEITRTEDACTRVRCIIPKDEISGQP